MSTLSSVILTVPYGAAYEAPAVPEGLRNLGFNPAPDDHGGEVWLMLDHKLNYRAENKWGIHGLRDLVLALPWRTHGGVASLLQVLWTDEHATADDSWGGRSAPYSWSHDTWTVPDPSQQPSRRA